MAEGTTTQPYHEARMIAGSEEKLQRVKDGESLEDILNEGKNPLYHLKRLGEVANSDSGSILKNVKSAYEIAKEGGKHEGFYRKWNSKRMAEIEKSIRSLQE